MSEAENAVTNTTKPHLWRTRPTGSAPLWQPGVSPNPNGRPKGASPRAALLRRWARNPDDDGIGAESVELGESVADACIELAHALDGDAVLTARNKLDGLLRMLAEVEPLPKETKRTDERVGRLVMGMLVCPQCGHKHGEEVAKQVDATVVEAQNALPDSASATTPTAS